MLIIKSLHVINLHFWTYLINRWPDVTPHISFPSKGKVLNRNKTDNSIKPNKFHSKYVTVLRWLRDSRRTKKIGLNLPLWLCGDVFEIDRAPGLMWLSVTFDQTSFLSSVHSI